MENKEESDYLSNTPKPNRQLYIKMLSISIIVTGISLLFPGTCKAFTVLAGIGCGGIASVIVAWLIDVSNCNQSNRLISHNREIVLNGLKRAFDHGVQLIVIACLSSEDNSHLERKKTWFEWIDAFYKMCKENPDRERDFCRCIDIFAEDIYTQSRLIQEQTGVLLDVGIIEEAEVTAISSIVSFCEGIRCERGLKESWTELANQNHMYCKFIKMNLDEAPLLKGINEFFVDLSLLDKVHMTAESKQKRSLDKASISEGGSHESTGSF